jgi:hypothetical protein
MEVSNDFALFCAGRFNSKFVKDKLARYEALVVQRSKELEIEGLTVTLW